MSLTGVVKSGHPNPVKPLSFSSSSMADTPFLFSLLKFLLFLSLLLLLPFSLILYSSLFSPPVPLDPTRLFSADLSCAPPDSNSSDPTRIDHLLFALSGSAKTWPTRRRYSELWWDNRTRGYVWLDQQPDPNVTLTLTQKAPLYKVSNPPPVWFKKARASDRIARIVKESFELGLKEVRWFVMGDDDTVFFTENLVRVLKRYDHREMYYIGGPSESVEQDAMHGYETAFGGGGFAVSYALACELVRILDGCIARYHHFYGSDEKISACVAELGVPLTRESGFHQLDIRGDPYGFLASHPTSPLISLHHLDHIKPLFPNQNHVASLKTLMKPYHIDPSRILQQSFCYDHRRKWSVSVSWGYTVQLYPSLLVPRELSAPLQTFRTWRSWSEGPFVFNTRPLKADRCEKPIIYYLDKVKDVGESDSLTVYKRVSDDPGKKCNQTSYKFAMAVEKIIVSASKMRPEKWMKKAPRRQCCEITNRRSMRNNMRVKIRSCKPHETITI